MGAIIGGVLGLVGAKMSADASTKAANTQAAAADKATKLQKYMYDTSRADQMPWLEAGKTALGTYMNELGIGSGKDSSGADYTSAFKTTPGYEFRVSEGTKGVLNNLSALGMKNSGKALKSLETFSQGIASQEYGNWLSNIAGISGSGQQGANSMAGHSAQAGSQIGQSIQNAGDARASGYVGASNAWSQGLQQVGNSLGQYFNGSNTSGFTPTNNGFSSMIYG
jgi:hypothetical protein